MIRARRLTVLVAPLAAVACVAGAFLPVHAATTVADAPGGPGCDPSRPAVAYRSGAIPAGAQPESAPVPCMVATGYGGAETQIAALNDGSVVYEPAVVTPGLAGTGFVPGAPGPQPSTQISPGGLAVSPGGSNGGTWRFVEPAGATWVPQDDAVYVDRRTGRLFYYALAANPVPAAGGLAPQDQIPAGEAHLMMSPDGGRTWTETALAGFTESENPRFASAPPPAGQPAPAGYPDVTYWCANNAVNLGLPIPGYRACYRSMDGGITWKMASVLGSSPVPQHQQCGSNAETFTDNDPDYPEGAPDGSVYAEVNCGSTTFLARSVDEGATWPLVENTSGQPVTLPLNGELRVGSRGTLYLVSLEGASAVNLRVSADGGRTWAPPIDMTPPGAGPVAQWAVAERGPGEVAVSYLVQRGTQAVYDGYLSFTRDATEANPVMWGAAINPISDPMRTSAPPQARDDYIGVDIAADGTPWASFAASCPGPIGGDSSPACAGQSSNTEVNQAIAGRLAQR